MARVAFFGTPAFAVGPLEALARCHEVVLVVSQPAKASGKGLRESPSPVAAWAVAHGVPLLTPRSLRSAETRAAIEAVPVEVSVVAAYGKILPAWLLGWPEQGCVNLHGSLLPKFRGASPISAAILAGETVTGITFMRMNEAMDEGDMLARSIIALDSEETLATLTERLSHVSAEHICGWIDDYLVGRLAPEAQQAEQATYCGIVRKDDGKVDFAALPDHVGRMIRSYHPWPGVWGEFRGKRVKLLPGGLVQMEGKRAVPLADFRHGYPDFPSIQVA